jgi:hypothetical protein
VVTVDSAPVTIAANTTSVIEATCPAGRVAIGGGFAASSGSLVSIDRNGLSGVAAWRLRATAGTSGASVVVTVICVQN